jgi:hypothetical protein
MPRGAVGGEIDLHEVKPGPEMEVLEPDPAAAARLPVGLFAGLDEAPEAPYLRQRADPTGLAALWEAAANL